MSTRSEYRVAEYTITPAVNGNVHTVTMDENAFESGDN
jgi:hypothetical protein